MSQGAGELVQGGNVAGQVAARLHLYLETLGLPRQIREALAEQVVGVVLGKPGVTTHDFSSCVQQSLLVVYDALLGRSGENSLDGRIWTAARALSGVAADQELACHVMPPLAPGHMAPHW